MSVMFANTRNTNANASGNLLEFPAGRVLLQPSSEPSKRKCVPETEKGLVYIKQSNDQLVHFCWKSRESSKNEDLIVFPGDTEYVKVKESTRVYMLKFKTGTQHLLFWMQDSNTAKDDEICEKVNDILNHPPTSRARTGAATADGGGGTMSSIAAINNVLGGSSDELGALGNMDQSQIMQLLSLMNGSVPNDGYMPSLSGKQDSHSNETPVNTGRALKKSAAAAAAANNNNNTGVVDSETLSAIIKALPTSSDTPSSSTGSRPYLDFSALLSRANVQETVMANAERLQPHLPDNAGQNEPRQELEQTIGNPQFRQAADFLGHAFQTGSIAEALPHFGIKDGAVASARTGDVLGFAKKLTEQEKRSEKRSSDASDPFDESGSVHETNEHVATGDPPKAKRGKTDENMDID